MEGDAVKDRDEEERPVRSAFGDRYVARVVDGEKDVCCAGEIWEGCFEFEGVGRLHEHKCHGGTEEDDMGGGVFFEFFTLEVPGEDLACCCAGEGMGAEGRREGVLTLPRMRLSVVQKISISS